MAKSSQNLYRPVGLKEMQLILDADARAFPPRLPEQPIFYPVLNLEYARQIAKQWNTKDAASGYVGYATQFEVDADYINQFDEQIVGGSTHRELWVPAEKLENFNQHIAGYITIVEAYYGEYYSSGAIDFLSKLEQHLKSEADIADLIKQQWKDIYLNYTFWSLQAPKDILEQFKKVWQIEFPHLKLPATH